MQSGRAEDESLEVRTILDALRRVVRDLRRDLPSSSQGLTPAQLFVLHALSDAGAIGMNELAARTYTHQSSVSVVAKTLAARGLLVRGRDAADGRRAVVTLTAKGRAALRRAPRAPQERLVAGVAALAPAARKALAASLRELVRAMALDAADPPMFFAEASPPPQRRRRARS